MAKKGKKHDNIEATEEDGITVAEAPEEVGIAVDMPTPETMKLKVKDLPDPREHPEMNIRSVTRLKDKTLAESVIASWNIEKLLSGIEAGAPNQVPPPYIAVWDKAPDILDLETGQKVPAFETELPGGEKVFMGIPDGNCRVICLKLLSEKYPEGHKVKLHVANPDGTTSEKEVDKKYDIQTCLVYRNLEPVQYHHLQLISGNRQSFTKGDIVRKAAEFILQRPTMRGLEKATLAHVGAFNVTVYTRAKDPHTAYQEWWRAALSPKDIRDGFIDYRNNKKGVAHPTPDDLRAIHPDVQGEIVSFTDGDVKPGVFYDQRISLRNHTFADIEAIWKQWTPEMCNKAAERAEKRADALTEQSKNDDRQSMSSDVDERKALNLKREAEAARSKAAWLRMVATKLRTGATPDKLSESLHKVKTMGDSSGQGPKQATMLKQEKLKEVGGELFQAECPTARLLVETIRGAKNAPESARTLDFQIRFEKRAWELLEKYDADAFLKFREEVDALTPRSE